MYMYTGLYVSSEIHAVVIMHLVFFSNKIMKISLTVHDCSPNKCIISFN